MTRSGKLKKRLLLRADCPDVTVQFRQLGRHASDTKESPSVQLDRGFAAIFYASCRAVMMARVMAARSEDQGAVAV
jgi:hypothetical protein